MGMNKAKKMDRRYRRILEKRKRAVAALEWVLDHKEGMNMKTTEEE